MATENPSLQQRAKSVERETSNHLSIEEFIGSLDASFGDSIKSRVPKYDKEMNEAREGARKFQKEFFELISNHARKTVRLNESQSRYIRSVLLQGIGYLQGGSKLIVEREGTYNSYLY